jgi:hypothetical protein
VKKLVTYSVKDNPDNVVFNALACKKGGLEFLPYSVRLFSDLNRALGSTHPQIGTRAIWGVKAASVINTNPITTDKSRCLRQNMVTNGIFPNAIRGVTGILTYLLCC